MNSHKFNTYEKSINTNGAATIFMVKEGGKNFIVVEGKNPGFEGETLSDEMLKAPLNHKNACVLRKEFPFTAPSQVLNKDRSFGVGDRLGIAASGHVKLFEQYDAYPVLAQQSIRELTLTNRSFEEVLDAATFAVFKNGFKKAWGADGDHLKTHEDVECALSLGFTMITLDCSEHINNNVTSLNAPPLPKNFIDKYLGKVFDIGEGLSLFFTEDELKETAAIYGSAIVFAADIYDQFFKNGKYKADLEISIDETSTPTTPLQHYFVACELLDKNVSFATLAPRFCGEFQKGVDYIGDIPQFEKEINAHAIIARHFKYKLSIHSGSDKFSVFPYIGKATKSIFHIKTAGTNWLEAMRIVTQDDPALYREIHKYALSVFDEAKKYYHVTTNLNKIPDVEKLKDSELPELFDQNDSRQLIHITYGLILKTYKDRLYKFWEEHEEDYEQAIIKHIGKHLMQLGVKKCT